MFRDNMMGVVLLGASCVVAVVIVWQIVTGDRLRYDGPAWVAWVLGIVMVVGILYAIFDNRIRGRNQQWPNPGAGQPSLLDRIRRKKDSGGSGTKSD